MERGTHLYVEKSKLSVSVVDKECCHSKGPSTSKIEFFLN